METRPPNLLTLEFWLLNSIQLPAALTPILIPLLPSLQVSVFFPREPRKNARELFHENAREYLGSAREHF